MLSTKTILDPVMKCLVLFMQQLKSFISGIKGILELLASTKLMKLELKLKWNFN